MRPLALGVARAMCDDSQEELAADILALQNELFVAGAELATAPEAAGRLEDGIKPDHRRDGRCARSRDRQGLHGHVNLPPKFVIPGGNRFSAARRRPHHRARPKRAVVRIQLADGLPRPKFSAS